MSQAPRVSIVCQNWDEDRIIPRMARALRDRLGWSLSAAPDPKADALYLAGYFEAQKLRPWPKNVPVAAYFTHREEEPPGNAKAKLYDQVAGQCALRVAMCRLYGEPLSAYGPTIQPPLPVEAHFVPQTKDEGLGTILKGRRTKGLPVVGFAGYTYANHRKGEDLARGIVESKPGQRCEWRASGRGWPVPTKRFSWAEMPQYYQGLDVLVCPSRVEGGPMPVLEALACGVRVVVPVGVGILDELPDTPGIYRYGRGDLAGMVAALDRALDLNASVDREALRQAVAGHTVEAFVEGVRAGVERMLSAPGAGVDGGMAGVDGGFATIADAPSMPVATDVAEVVTEPAELIEHGTGSTRGIYCVAFGEPARESCLRMMESAKRHMPDIPIALCAAAAIGPENVLIVEPDSDVGGRRAKLKAYELAPAEWQAVLYLDADTEVVAPIYRFWEWVEDGWEFVICKDPHLMDTMASFERRNNAAETADVKRAVHTLSTLQFNGGVWAFGRNERIAAFFRRWQAEWERYAQRDQGALIRALYADPLKVWLLSNEWNTFPKYSKGVVTAGLMHYPGEARRWEGLLPGRIDSPAAWEAVKRFEGKRCR